MYFTFFSTKICKLVDERGNINQLKFVPPRSAHLLKKVIDILPTKDTSKEKICSIFAGPNATEIQTLVHNRTHLEVAREGPNDNDENLKNEKRRKFLEILTKHNISANNTVIAEIVTAAISASKVNGLDLSDFTEIAPSDWNLGSAVFFCGTIVTTIGYGNIHPRTTWGRAFCIIFATFGIPFTGVVLGKMGLGLSNLIKTADAFIEDRIKQCFPKASEKENIKSYVRSIQLGFVITMFILIFLILPAAVMTKTESKWSFFDGFYFCFISLSTIGLGDITPGASENGIEFKAHFGWESFSKSLHQVSIILYLLTGLAALTIILALVGSLMTSAAKKTLKGGTGLMGAGGQQLVGGARRFASSFRQKAASAMQMGNGSSLDKEERKHRLKVEGVPPEKAPMADYDDSACDDLVFSRLSDHQSEAGVDGGGSPPDEIVIENDDAENHEMITSETVSLQSGTLFHCTDATDGSRVYLNHGLASNDELDLRNTVASGCDNQNSVLYVIANDKGPMSMPTAEG
eukprot:gene20637-22672_t